MEGGQDDNGTLLRDISNEIVRAQKQYFGKGPVKARSYMVDDLLFVVMRGGMTVAEETMLEFNMHDLVREFRQVFENKMNDRMIGIIEDLTGRKVATYQSQVLFDPNIVIEIFVFDDTGPAEGRHATALGQSSESGIGAATDDDALEQPAQSGQ